MYRLAMLGWQKHSFAPTYGSPIFLSFRSNVFSCGFGIFGHEAIRLVVYDSCYCDVCYRIYGLEKAKGLFRDDHSIIHAFWPMAFDVVFGSTDKRRFSESDGIRDSGISYSKFCLPSFPNGKRQCSVEHVGWVLSQYALLACYGCSIVVFNFTIIV